MTTTDEHLNRTRHGVSADDRNERAKRAVTAFRAMQHGLTSYARAITGNKHITVELSTGVPRTDGRKIYYQPPIALGDKTPHDRRNCDKRDEIVLIQLCPACAVREEVLVNIYHEIGHIAGGSFSEVPDHVKKNATQKAIEEWGGKYAEQIKRRFEAAPGRITGTYKGLAGLISPYLPYLVNCIEDARVDCAMFEARKGIRTMMEASTISIFTEGCEQADGTMKQWAENPLNAQASIACYLAACGYKGWERWLHESVAEAFADEKIRALLVSVADMTSAQQTYEVSFPVLARLRELGFFQMPEDKEEEKDEQDESGDPGDEGETGEESSDESDSSDAGEGGGETAGDNSGEGQAEDSDAAEGDSGGAESEDLDGSSDVSGEDAASDESEDEESDGSGGTEPDDEEAGDGPEEEDADGSGSGSQADEAEGSGGDESLAEGEVDADSGGEPDESGDAEAGSVSDTDSVPDPADAEADEDSGPEQDGPGEGGTGPAGEPDAEPDSSEEDEDGGSDQESEGTDGDGDTGDAESDASGMAASPHADYRDEDGDDDSEADEAEAASADAGPDGEQSEDGDADESEASDPEGDEAELDERIDTGADEGEGGVELEPAPPPGEPEDLEGVLEHFHRDDIEVEEAPEDEAAVQIAIIQGLYFEKPSENVMGVREHKFDHPLTNKQGTRLDQAWAHDRMLRFYRHHLKATEKETRFALGIDAELDVPEEIMGPALLQTRRVFTDNETAKQQRNLRTGRVNKAVLGRRGWNDDDRLFTKKRLPGKRSYAVVLGIDVSGSTVGENLALAKRAAWAQAELCARAGIDFAMFAHSANRRDGGLNDLEGLWLDIYEIKGFSEPWDSNRQHRLRELGSDSENLDGHSMEYYRKQLDAQQATDKILLYYTDGKMPAANHDEELQILQREIKICKSKGYTLLGVGIRTDSPVRHGLDTVQVNDDNDLKAVVMHLEKRLIRSGSGR